MYSQCKNCDALLERQQKLEKNCRKLIQINQILKDKLIKSNDDVGSKSLTENEILNNEDTMKMIDLIVKRKVAEITKNDKSMICVSMFILFNFQ